MSTNDDYEKIFALKPIPKDERMRQVRWFKPEVKKRMNKLVKEGILPRKSSVKRGQSST